VAEGLGPAQAQAQAQALAASCRLSAWPAAGAVMPFPIRLG